MGNRYLVISPAFPPPNIGGSKVWTFNLVEHCPADADVLTSSLKSGFNEIVSPRHHVYRRDELWDSNTSNPTKRDLVRSYTYIIGWLLLHARPSRYRAIVGGAFDFCNGFIILSGRLLRIPVICLGNAEEFTLTLHGRGWKNRIKRWWLRFTHRRATAFVVVCDFCKEVLVSIGVRADTIHVVPSSINPEKLRSQRHKVSSGRRVMSVGRLVERKGFHYLVQAIARLRSTFPDLTLTIVGDGPFRSTLETIIREMGASDYVTLTGAITDEQLVALYDASDIFVLAHVMLPNGDTEGCPTVFSEASGNGLPVIGGIEGGASTVIIDGVTGYIVNPRDIAQLADRLERLLRDPEMARRMGVAGREKIRREHTPEVTGLAFYRVLEKYTHGVLSKENVCLRTE